MTTIHHDEDADPKVLDGQTAAVVGYGNQGRSWASQYGQLSRVDAFGELAERTEAGANVG